MADEILRHGVAADGPEAGAAVVGTAGGVSALFSAAACCVLPLAFAAFGLGTGGLAAFVPYHWPLTIASALAVSVGWLLYFRKRRACLEATKCAPKRGMTFVLLCVATVFVVLSAAWPGFIEGPVMALLEAE